MGTDVYLGERVIVRTFKGYPCVRKLWQAGPVGCVVAEDQAFERLVIGDASGAVYVPAEDVFFYNQAIAAKLDPAVPFKDWEQLVRYESGLASADRSSSR